MIEPFTWRSGRLHCEQVALADLAARFGTPLYVYSRARIEQAWNAFDTAFGERSHLVCYAVKANGNLSVLDALARLGAGFDIVSAGELERVLAAGGDAARVVFSGVGKGSEEISRALELGIRCFNVESLPELERLSGIAQAMGRRAPVALRVNPDVDPQTHPYIATGLKSSKFGIDIDAAMDVYRCAAGLPGIEIRGIACHIGSQITTLAPFRDAATRVAGLVRCLRAEGVPLRHVDLGGGLAARYVDENPPDPADYVAALCAVPGLDDLEIVIEPGRSIVAEAGVLLARVEYLKEAHERCFVIVDAAMNDLMRPALYEAFHEIVPVVRRTDVAERVCEVVGPVCESGDVLGHERRLAVAEGDLLAIMTAGAYGFAMSSNYNARPRAAEVLVDGNRVHLARARETVAQLIGGEQCLP